jgi:hypothetical protein
MGLQTARAPKATRASRMEEKRFAENLREKVHILAI